MCKPENFKTAGLEMERNRGKKLINLEQYMHLLNEEPFASSAMNSIGCMTDLNIQNIGVAMIESDLDRGRRWYQLKTLPGTPHIGLMSEEVERLALCRDLLERLLPQGIIGEIETTMFKATNARLEAKVSALNGWSGEFDLVLDNDSGKTRFAPQNWAESGLFYFLDETDDDTEFWPSTALGLRKSRLCLKITPDPKLRERPKQKGPRLLSRIHAETDIFHQHHIDLDAQNSAFYIPFVLEAEKVIAEYPNLSDSLAPVDWAFDNILAAHEHYERIAKGELADYGETGE